MSEYEFTQIENPSSTYMGRIFFRTLTASGSLYACATPFRDQPLRHDG